MAKEYDSTISDLDELLDASRAVRKIFEPQWVLNIAMYLGQHWIQVDTAGFISPVTEPRVTLTENRIRPAVRIAIAKQTKTPPIWVGVPKDPSDEEIQRARLRSIVFEHYWRSLNARRLLNSALWYREVCGSGFWKQTWDDTLGEKTTVLARPGGGPVLADQYGRPMKPEAVQGMDPMALGQVETREITTGDVRLELRSPFEMFPDALASEEGLDSCEYIGEEAIYSLEYMQRRYPDQADQIQENTSPSAGIMESRFPGLGGVLRDGRTNRGAKGRRGVKVREIWTSKHHCVWTSDGIELLQEANPYPFKPYTMFGGLEAGRFWRDAPVNDLVSPNVELDKTISQIAENGERFGNPSRFREASSLEQTEDWQGLPGEEIIYTDMGNGLNVGFIQPPEMPVYVQNRPQDIRDTINHLSGQNEVSQGTVPTGVTAASAISMLLEANDTQLGPMIAEMGDSLVDSGKQILWYLRAFAKTERMAQIAGDESMFDIYAWNGERLGDASADEIEVGSAISNSQAMRQTVIRDMLNLLIQNGQVPPPRELRKLMRALGVGGTENFFATIGRAQRFIVDEHRRLLAGEAFGTNLFDDDQIHLDEHQDWQMSATYQEAIRKPGIGQVLQQNAEMHIQEHRDKLQNAANQQAAAQANMTALEKGLPGTETAPPPAQSNGNGSVPPGQPLPSA